MSSWNATFATSGSTVTATNPAYNGTIPADGAATIGFQATRAGTAAAPTAFTLDGAACAVA